METGKLHYRQLGEEEAGIVDLFTEQDSFWRSVETKEMTGKEYLKKYQEGEWRIWQQGDKNLAITYHLENSPSNHKPWLGTVVVNPAVRRHGLGIKVVEELKKELRNKKHKAIFVGVPVHASVWIQFLSDCYFEQFKVEKDEQDEMYVIMVSPLQ